ncbi:MarC family protein [Microvirga sp. W0021]|uniref:UPF0056 membrane protein n=1 Tax=Hohaiivirga grylli TaxID=3133970 RepID=A0ABV0BIT4_9HYPH
MPFDTFTSALVTLLVTLDPIALAPVFLSLTHGMSKAERNQVGFRASLIAFVILAFFCLGGEAAMRALGIGLPAFRIAGGLLLFWIACEMVFEKRTERKAQTAETAITKDHIRNVAAFPLGIPLLAGPGTITVIILYSGQAGGNYAYTATLLLAIAIGVLCCFLVFLVAQTLSRILGVTGNIVMSRLFGMILAGMAVQFILDGIKAAFS